MSTKGNTRFNDAHDRDTGNPLSRTETPLVTDAMGIPISVEQVVSTQREPSRPLRVLGIDDDGTVWCEPTEDDGDIEAHTGTELVHGYMPPEDWDMEVDTLDEVLNLANTHLGDPVFADHVIHLCDCFYRRLYDAKGPVRLKGACSGTVYYSDLVDMGGELIKECKPFVYELVGHRCDLFSSDREVAALYLAISHIAELGGFDWEAYADGDNHDTTWMASGGGEAWVKWDVDYRLPDAIELDETEKDVGLWKCGVVRYYPVSGDQAPSKRCPAHCLGDRVMRADWDAARGELPGQIVLEVVDEVGDLGHVAEVRYERAALSV